MLDPIPSAPAFDCADCGACCREAYHAVEVHPRDRFVRLHPDRVAREEGRLVVMRAGLRCACLTGDVGTFACDRYADRPKTCRDFERGGENCAEARKRVGLR
ncbi:MAG: YkgJ family cysteine cluster protein [Myxococcota bacterium]